jgi:mono/diheme cytochrome c family protein
MRASTAALLVVFVAASASLPAPAQDKKKNAPVSFSKEVLPILSSNCAACHDSQKKGGLDLSSYATASKGGKTGKIWMAGNPAKSLLIMQISGDKPKMPAKGSPVSKDDVDLISKWIMQGALNN